VDLDEKPSLAAKPRKGGGTKCRGIPEFDFVQKESPAVCGRHPLLRKRAFLVMQN